LKKCVKITVRATSANLGVGFDVCAITLNLTNEFLISFSDKLTFMNFDSAFKNDQNLVYQAYKKTCQFYDVDEAPLHINLLKNDIPVARGLGSSASCIVAGVMACNALHNLELSQLDLFNMSAQIEGHKDNVAAAIYGGFVSVLNDDTTRVINHDIHENYMMTLVIPNFKGSTEKLRQVIPKKLSLNDAVFHFERLMALYYGFKTVDIALLKQLLKDKVHQTKRLDVLNLTELFHSLSKFGAVALSGSGPSIIIFHDAPIDLKEQSVYQVKQVSLGKAAQTEVVTCQ
jgi:homoserine kinase